MSKLHEAVIAHCPSSGRWAGVFISAEAARLSEAMNNPTFRRHSVVSKALPPAEFRSFAAVLLQAAGAYLSVRQQNIACPMVFILH